MSKRRIFSLKGKFDIADCSLESPTIELNLSLSSVEVIYFEILLTVRQNIVFKKAILVAKLAVFPMS